MSGVLLTVAFYVLLRFKAIADGALGVGFSRTLFVTVGLLSLMVAASLLLSQRDYKRMLAYHSVEHMGLIALGAAAGTPLAIAAVLLHVLGHGLAKAVLFLASGEILLVEGTTEIDQVKALLARRPALGESSPSGSSPCSVCRPSVCSSVSSTCCARKCTLAWDGSPRSRSC